MDCITDPLRGVLAHVEGFGIIGGADEPRRRGHVVRLAPLELGAVPQIMLNPDLAQDTDGGKLAPPERRVRMTNSGKQPPAIVPNGQCESGTGRMRGWEPIILGALGLAVLPV